MPQAQSVSGITVEQPAAAQLQELGVSSWPIWTKGTVAFDWHYDELETCYFLEGDVVIKTVDGEVSIGTGDLVRFPKHVDCTWQIKQAVRKHYRCG